jgi:hypothetical protein
VLIRETDTEEIEEEMVQSSANNATVGQVSGESTANSTAVSPISGENTTSNATISLVSTTAEATTSSNPVATGMPLPVSAIEFPLKDSSQLHSYACPFNCHGNGICQDKTCFCHSSYTGTACESKRHGSLPLFPVACLALVALCIGLLVSYLYIRQAKKGGQRLPGL